jgi:hypothetical protein
VCCVRLRQSHTGNYTELFLDSDSDAHTSEDKLLHHNCDSEQEEIETVIYMFIGVFVGKTK